MKVPVIFAQVHIASDNKNRDLNLNFSSKTLKKFSLKYAVFMNVRNLRSSNCSLQFLLLKCVHEKTESYLKCKIMSNPFVRKFS